MNTLDKVKLLSDAGKFDICASSSSPRSTTTNDRVGNAASGGICHSFTENGRCVSLFKTLMTNSCNYDCKYCTNSNHCAKKIAMYTPEELAKVFMHLYLRNYVEGIFLSSGVNGDSNKTTEKMIDAIKLLREKYKFHGYVHFKALPGVNKDLINEASEYSDRISINLEAPNKSALSEISQVKDYKIDILRRQSWIKNTSIAAGQTTQLVVGASNETDKDILSMSNWEYQNMELKRVYYSAFTPVENTPFQNKTKTSLEREHKLYNVDFMLRKYNIQLKEFKPIFVDGNLPKGDPKVHLANYYFNKPIDVNDASYDELIRIPGIGPQSAYRITELNEKHIKIQKKEQLSNLGVILKRAEPFLKINGMTQMRLGFYA